MAGKGGVIAKAVALLTGLVGMTSCDRPEEDELQSANSGQAPDSGLQGNILSTVLDDLYNEHLESMKQFIETMNKDIMSEVIEIANKIDKIDSYITQIQQEIEASKRQELEELELERGNLYRENGIEPLK